MPTYRQLTPALLEYGPIENIINFLHFYRNHHTLDEVPKATIRTMESEYATVAERTKALQYHTASLQRPENSGIQLYIKCLAGILVTLTEFRQPLQVQSHLEMPGILVQLGHIQRT